jgi:hypothetical protein
MRMKLQVVGTVDANSGEHLSADGVPATQQNEGPSSSNGMPPAAAVGVPTSDAAAAATDAAEDKKARIKANLQRVNAQVSNSVADPCTILHAFVNRSLSELSNPVIDLCGMNVDTAGALTLVVFAILHALGRWLPRRMRTRRRR